MSTINEVAAGPLPDGRRPDSEQGGSGSVGRAQAAILVSGCSYSGMRPVSLDMDPVLVLARLHEVVGGLAPQSELGIGPAGLFQPKGQFRRNCRVSFEHANAYGGQRRAPAAFRSRSDRAVSDSFRGCCARDAEDRPSPCFRLLLVVIDQVDVVSVAVLETKGDRPISGFRDAPVPL